MSDEYHLQHETGGKFISITAMRMHVFLHVTIEVNAPFLGTVERTFYYTLLLL
jgi:hypothetical protein